MATLTSDHSEKLSFLAGVQTQVRRSGSGAPLLVIHGELGVPGWLDSYQLLSKDFDVIVPSLPGFGGSERPDWIMGAHDLAAWVSWFVRDSGIEAPLNVIGCSLGGWIAAEMATIAPQFFNKLVLVGPMGVKPREGEIFDYFLESGVTGLRRAFYAPDACEEFSRYYGKELTPEDIDSIEQHREMTCRVAWKPYMHSLTLPSLLPAIRTPTLLIWGERDAIVPLDSGIIYNQAIAGSKLVKISECGHMPEMEKPDEFVSTVRGFLISSQ